MNLINVWWQDNTFIPNWYLNHKMQKILQKHDRFFFFSSLLITAYILLLGISYFILSAAPTGQCQSVQWHSHATPTQHPLMGEQVLDRVQWSRAERAAMIYQMNRPAPTPLARGRGTQPFIKCVLVCGCVCLCRGSVRPAAEQQWAPTKVAG